MTSFPFHRILCALAGCLALGLGVSAMAATPVFQPLHTPPTGQQHPGKFVWADLFTTDPVAATKFYTGLFGWTTNIIDQQGKAYTVFSNGSRPVAGLAPRNTANSKRPSRWISYIAVTDLPAALARATKAGGTVRAPARDMPDRGVQAIITDQEGSPVGLLQSRSGDAIDDEPKIGEWNWFELYGREPKAAATFYAAVFHYDVAADDRTVRKNDYLLNTDDRSRAGVAPLPAGESATPGWLGVVRVENIDVALQRAVTLGGEVLVPARATAYGSRFAIIADPTGGTLGLVQYVDNANPAANP